MMMRFVLLTALACVCVACAPANDSSAKSELAEVLDTFMEGVDERGVHDAFWADDLVYTSSNGTRFGKQIIMAGFDDDGDVGESVEYAAEDVDIRVYGDTAVVVFQLLGVSADTDTALRYFNTGMFVKRGGRWQAVAWQATKIPEQE